MSLNVPSSLDTPQNFIPVIPPAKRWKFAGVGTITCDSMADLTAAIAAEVANVANGTPALPAEQAFRVAGEPMQAARIWSRAAGHARLVLIAGAIEFTLVSNTNAIGVTTGAPSNSAGANGDLRLDKATGSVFQKGASVWGAAAFGFAVSTPTSAPSPAPAPAPSGAHQFAKLVVNAFNGGSNVTMWALKLFTADDVDRAAGLPYVSGGGAQAYGSTYPLTDGHTNSSNWYGPVGSSALFDFTTPRAITYIEIDPGNTPVGNANQLPTDVSLWVGDTADSLTELHRWQNITVGDWGSNNAQIVRRFDVSSQSVTAPTNSVAPTITGTAQVGATLTAVDGTWTGSPTFAHQWKRDGTAISGATGQTYQPVTADIGHAITVTVTGTNSAGNASATSAATSNVIAASSGPVAKQFAMFRVNSANGAEANIFALNLFTSDNVDRAAGLTYVNANAADYPDGNVLTNGHTNASNWYSTAFPASALFDFGTPRAIDHIAVKGTNTVVSGAQHLPTSISLLTGDTADTLTVAHTWDNITTDGWGTDNNAIARVFTVS